MVSTRGQRTRAGSPLEDTIIRPLDDWCPFITLKYPKSTYSAPLRRNGVPKKGSPPVRQSTLTGRIKKSSKPLTVVIVRETKVVVQKTKRVIVHQPEDTPPKSTKRASRSFKLRLSKIDYSRLPKEYRQLDYKLIRHQNRIKNYKGLYFPPPPHEYHNRYGFMFGHNPFQHIGFQPPSSKQQWHVYNLMKKDLKENFNKDCFLDQPDATTNELQNGPMHMSDDLSVDNLVKVILSISTENSLAHRQHDQLCSLFTYTVDGKEVKGLVPNYHKMRVCSAEELVRALNIAGHHNLRQKAFHSILNEIHEQNVRRLPEGQIVPPGNEAGARDFVPGMLSMEYLKGDGLSKQEQFDMLVKFDQIAVKTGCCLLAFNLKIPVFVVDTHVHHMARNLEWIPADCMDADRACMFLDTMMPTELKFGLHQAFWHHRINCARCWPRANPSSEAYKKRSCPLEGLINRNLPPLNRSAPRDGKSTTRIKKDVVKTSGPKKLPGSVTFLNMHYKVAKEKGYALRKVHIDDDFGDGSRQNKDGTASYYWGLKKFAHANDIVKFEDALRATGLTETNYEAKFVKKTRVTKTKTVTRKMVVEISESTDGGDVEMDDQDTMNEMDIDQQSDDYTNDDGDGDSDYDNTMAGV